MSTLVFDIETVGEEWESFDETTKQTLSRWILRTMHDETAREAALRDVREGLGFSPLTGRIVAIGLYDVERKQGVVYYDGDAHSADIDDGVFLLKSRTEREMLEDFWEGAKSYDTFVTFNGRGFDVPFLMLRGAILGVHPTQRLMDGRYLYQQKGVQHIDLQDQMTFYGALHRRPSLHLFCRAFGIASPKSDGVSGDDVSALYRAGEYETIARYNARDVIATAELYEKWRAYLAPSDPGDTIDFH